jgi:hypothetical protein
VWAAILGAIVGGTLALVGSMLVELRRDRRRQIGSARLIVAELWRAAAELESLNDGQVDWLDGPHHGISASEWFARAHEFVGTLTDAEFNQIDRTTEAVRVAGEYGFTKRTGLRLPVQMSAAAEIVSRVGQIRRRDRVLWRL